MKLIVQPDEGLSPLLGAVRKAKRSIDIVIFRFDREELAVALAAALSRGVEVRALIAHTNRGGEKGLRKLEQRLLDLGMTVARTPDELPRYHGKMMLVDDSLHVFAFNFTKLDIDKSRSFGITTRDRGLVKEAAALFEADRTRQPYSSSHSRLVVSPDSSRELLSKYIRGARRQLLIYDQNVCDPHALELLSARASSGVDVRVLGSLDPEVDGIEVRKLNGLRLHARAIIRDGQSAFVGSQSLRRLELDGRREIGVIVNQSAIAKRMEAIFERDWATSG